MYTAVHQQSFCHAGLRRPVSAPRWCGRLTLLFGMVCLCWTGSAQPTAQSPAAAPLRGLVPQHVTLSVSDLPREVDWYTRVLGCKLEPHDDSNPAFLNYHMSLPGYRIDLIRYQGSQRPAAPNPLYLRQGWIHIAFSVPDLPLALRQLQALGTDAQAGSADPQGRPTRLILHDPEGNEIEFFGR